MSRKRGKEGKRGVTQARGRKWVSFGGHVLFRVTAGSGFARIEYIYLAAGDVERNAACVCI